MEQTMQQHYNIRAELEGVARAVSDALGQFDLDPNPSALDRILLNGPCRICRLLWERCRSISAFIERDPDMLDRDTTRNVLQIFLADLNKHQQTTQANAKQLYPDEPEKHVGHDPLANYAKAMIESVRKK